MNKLKINNHEISKENTPFIIAEAGINHNGSVEKAVKMVKTAKNAGVSAIKFQTFKAHEFITDSSLTYTYTSQGKSITESQLDLFKRCEISNDDFYKIKKICDDEKIIFLSTPQNKSDLDFLLELGVSAIKVGSDDFTNIPLLKYYSKTKLPILISCGMTTLKEIKTEESSLKKVLNTFGFDESIETFDVAPSIEILVKEEISLAASLNAIAPQKYVEISTGYRESSNRKNELEAERNAVVAFIEGIEKDKRQTFLDAFDTVDKEIREIFTKMNGGNAWLELENEDDIFDSGISYFIQFQNKPKRESNSISGGEKTLAAVVFVLALQKLKPSPFYLFDEIDAHLDAPNSERLSKIVEERSHGSQFIMVSLKDSVVEKAKLIYGVFPKNGVSNVVTYKDKRLPSITN